MAKILKKPTRSTYDNIVVGSGSAGAVVARRLADAGHKVLLIEAGPNDDHIHIRMPAALGLPLGNDRFNWRLESEPEPHLNNRRILEARGRVLGGSSSINGMNWVRGNPADYDHWRQLGLEGWSYDEVLPYFRRSETFDKGGNSYRGGDGPMQIETCGAKGPLYDAFLSSAEQWGMERVADHNAYRQEGVHVTQRNVGRGLRWSTARGYLHELPDREGFDICVQARLLKIEFSGKRAVRARIDFAGEARVIGIEQELVLCAGAIHSPQLLKLSGIGNADELREHGIDVVQHLPGVGEGLKDHVAAPVMYRATQNVSAAKELSTFGKLKLGAQWVLAKKGLGATNFFEVGAFIRTDDSVSIPNVQFEFVPMLGEMQHGSVKLENGFQYFFSLMRPRSEGRVWLRDADPRSNPKFVFNYFADENDRREAIAAIRIIRDVISQNAWDPYRGEEVMPGIQHRSDEEIFAFLQKEAGTNYHPCCTCRMGTGDMAVTDAQARVHGIENMRVVDASIMPDIVSGNLNAPVIMMGERVSDMMLGRSLPPASADYYKTEGAAA
uniref:Choline dehydrogenase n=2 Tax=Alloyangia mangrovi TaxID=1779329 RepID=A0A2A3K012_9RHOB